MATVGRALLILALAVAAYGIFASIYGARSGRPDWVVSGRRAVYAIAALVTGAFAILEGAFLRSDFTFATVAAHSSTTTPTFYRAAAAWSSQEGSLLLWLWLLSLWASLVLFLTRRTLRRVAPYATAVLLGFAAFFTGLLVFLETPFGLSAVVPLEGNGLNPLLRHPSMMIHPPMLYSGYTLFTIPFAFAVGALIARQVGAADWIRATRRFALAAWLCLGVGVLLGARWSYAELGWGGYWGWDPVENASLMPWLIGTAFLHSIQVQEKRGMLKVWNVSLIVGTFALCLLGTFLVRSGVLQSIHAFGASTVGAPLLVMIGVVLLGSTLLIVSRLDDLRSERRIESLMSREAVFLINNLLLVGMVALIFWGTFFPLISEAFTGTRSSLASPWFDRYVTPVALLLVLFTGIGPLVAWGRFGAAAARRVLIWPTAAAGIALVALLAISDTGGHPWALALFCLAAFALTALAQEFWRAGTARRSLTGEPIPVALAKGLARNRRRYGGYLVHAGIAVLLIGIAASSSFQTNRDLRLDVGQSADVGNYRVTYDRPTVDVANERIAFGAVLDVQRDGKQYAVVSPARNYYPSQDPRLGPIGRFFNGDATSEVGLKPGAGQDLWTAFQPDLKGLEGPIKRANRKFADSGPDVQGLLIAAIAQSYLNDPPPATFRVIINPLISWLYIGGLIAIGGALIGLWPSAAARRRVTAASAARIARGLSRA
ncbi:MAG: cytochrome c-type biosis protein CcmF [Solirubrobacteraceae bacterium]|nr:cytochrome c-type biosis protein CcmF [Solirubrobacteraceae bacterium]